MPNVPSRTRAKIRTAEDQHRPSRTLPGLTAPERIVAEFWQGAFMTGELTLPKGQMKGVSIPVVVNHGRWLVRCAWCHSTQYASREDHRFYCVECDNGGSGEWVKTEWPLHAARIEKALGRRPMKHHRNWETNESVGDLVHENDLHKVA
jgi:hypothetical protein